MSTYDELMKFAFDFVSYYEEYDIKDKLNKQTNKMETSPGVHDLVKRARLLVPEKKGKIKAANDMRDMPEPEREKAIETSSNVINLRADFSKRISANGGLRALIAQLVDAQKVGDLERAADIFAEMETFTMAERGEETFGEKTNG